MRHLLSSYSIKALTLLPTILCRHLSRLYPRNHKKIAIGAWYGNLYGDNPKYFAEYLLAHTDFDVTWIGKKNLRDELPHHHRMHFAEIGSWDATKALLCAKYWVCCIFPYFDLTPLPIDGGAICINLWHGIPAKRVGQHTIWDFRSIESKGLRAALERMYVRVTCGDKQWLSLASAKMEEIQLEAYPTVFSSKKMLRIGSPRNDFLINNRDNASLKASIKAKYAALLNFDPNKKIILYLPTWRIRADKPFLFCNLPSDKARLVENILCEHKAVLIEKPHIHTYEQTTIDYDSRVSTVVKIEQLSKIDTQELLLIADILICDYSSVYLDFALLKRPVLHFLYDIDTFLKNDMGMAYDIRSIAAGKISSTVNALIDDLKNELLSPQFKPAQGYYELVKFEIGEASARLVDFIRGCDS